MRLHSYACRIVALNGASVSTLARASSALAALHNVRRARKGDWQSIQVGYGEGAEFRALAEVAR